jgi:hypothetical protein
MPINHRKRWSAHDLKQIYNIASSFKTKQQMYNAAPLIANQFGRTESAVCKKIEQANGWYWA